MKTKQPTLQNANFWRQKYSFPSLLQSAEDQRRQMESCGNDESDSYADSYYNLRDDGRNPDGSGESYVERNQ